MAAAQAAQPHDALKWGASLLIVCLAAKALTLPAAAWQRPWVLPVFVWQDVVLAAVFGVLALALRGLQRWITVVYVLLGTYVAVNVPIVRLMSTPLTWPMLKAARGALRDSIGHQISIGSVASIVAVLAALVGAPLLMRRMKVRALVAFACACAAALAVGWPLMRSVETLGRHRNALLTLVTSAFPRLEAQQGMGEWRKSPFESESALDLTHLRGLAAGRNVVLILLESHGAEHLGLYGAVPDPMPNLTALARQAVVFENAYTVYPESIKSLAATLCSRWPAMDTGPELYERGMPASIAEVLRERGYATALFHSGRFDYLGMRSLIEGRGFDLLEDAGHISGVHRSSFGVEEPATVRRMLQWVDGIGKDRPFFLTYLPIAGHHPYQTPTQGPFHEEDEQGCYRNALHYGDQSLGALVEGLRERGLFDKTIFVIFGDHGEGFGRHEGNYGHTNFIYEENVRIPYLIVMPGIVDATVRAPQVIGTLDTCPTILDLLGMQPPDAWQGESLLEGVGRMALFFTDYSSGLLGLRDGDWKFIHELESGRSKLFRLSTDAAEKVDLSEREPGRVQKYRELLLRWAAAQRERVLNGR